MQEAVRKARQLMHQRKLQHDRTKPVTTTHESRDRSSTELREFLELESSVRGYGSAPLDVARLGTPAMASSYCHVPQSVFLKRVVGEHARLEESRKKEGGYCKEMRKAANTGHSYFSKIEVEARAHRAVGSPIVSYQDMSSVKKSIQKKAANFSPVVAHRNQVLHLDKSLDDSFSRPQLKTATEKKHDSRKDLFCKK